jgi:hypothetical protein
LLENSFDDLNKLFRELDGSFDEDETGLISFKDGISLYSLELQKVESVLVFEEGYYE